MTLFDSYSYDVVSAAIGVQHTSPKSGGGLVTLFDSWMPLSMKLNEEPWWKFTSQSSWDVRLLSLIPFFGGLCEERLPCFLGPFLTVSFVPSSKSLLCHFRWWKYRQLIFLLLSFFFMVRKTWNSLHSPVLMILLWSHQVHSTRTALIKFTHP